MLLRVLGHFSCAACFKSDLQNTPTLQTRYAGKYPHEKFKGFLRWHKSTCRRARTDPRSALHNLKCPWEDSIIISHITSPNWVGSLPDLRCYLATDLHWGIEIVNIDSRINAYVTFDRKAEWGIWEKGWFNRWCDRFCCLLFIDVQLPGKERRHLTWRNGRHTGEALGKIAGILSIFLAFKDHFLHQFHKGAF